MKQYIIQVLIGLPFVVLGSIYGPQLRELGATFAYILIGSLWVVSILASTLLPKPEARKLLPSLVIATAICIPLLLALVHFWLAIFVGALLTYAGYRWGDRLGQASWSNNDPNHDG